MSDKAYITMKKLCILWNASETRVTNLIAKAGAKRHENGLYEWSEMLDILAPQCGDEMANIIKQDCIKNYDANVRRAKSQMQAMERNGNITESDRQSTQDLQSENLKARTEKTIKETQIAELKLAEMNRELIPYSEAYALANEKSMVFAQNLKALPSRVITQLMSETDELTAKTILQREIDKVINTWIAEMEKINEQSIS